MSRFMFGLLLVLGMCCVAAPGWSDAPPHYTELTFPQLSDWPHVQPQTFTLPNKARVVVIEDHELPLVRIQVLVRCGEAQVPEGQEGLGKVAVKALRSGGSRSYPGEELNALLENKAAKLSVDMRFASTKISLDLLRRDLDSLVPVLGDLLAHPRFPEDKIAWAKKQVLTEIARRNDNQQEVAFREFKRLVYGPETVYGRLPDPETVQDVRRDDIRDLHARHFTGANMLIGVVGDVRAERVQTMLAESMSAVPAGKPVQLDFPPVEASGEPKQQFIHMPGVNQVSILMGHKGGLRQSKDYAALQVMNAVLSQGFSSRLFQNLRSRMGLAYSVYGRFGSKYFYPGVFLAGLKTRSANMVLATKALKKEIVTLHRDGVTGEELQRAKEEFVNSLVFRYETPKEILDRQLYYAYRDMPADSFERLVENIRDVRVKDVNRAAARHLHPDRLQTLMVGNRDMVQDQLSEFPEMKIVELEKGD
ncbi:M16 family metallopeptidase [Desulfovermiculus halophilus]|uniref:M16 family metallopeptidase n=1 Tax=Desulfovermiculus halophilus TaxID=339722 RepID=UPI00048106E7|nr:pitrilysin family protein [Desulfovermiculus halophilus]